MNRLPRQGEQRRTKRRKDALVPFDALRHLIDLDVGYVTIAFMKQAPEERERILRGETRNEHINAQFREELQRTGAVDDGEVMQSEARKHVPWTARLMAWLPAYLVEDAVRGFSSTLDYVHCEMVMYLNDLGRRAFPEKDVIALAVTADEGVIVKPRSFHVAYEWQNVTCAATNMLAMLHWCCERRGRRFSLNRMTNIPIYPGELREDVTYCVQFVAQALQFTPHAAFHVNPPNKLTIDDFYELVVLPAHRPACITRQPQAHFKRIAEQAGAERVFIDVDPRRAHEFSVKI
jgi:hypothetical protein